MFILTFQLKGYTRRNIMVESNEDGTKIKVSGQKPVQDVLMVGGKVMKKDIEMRGFQQWFKVPQGVIFNQVNARDTNAKSYKRPHWSPGRGVASRRNSSRSDKVITSLYQ